MLGGELAVPWTRNPLSEAEFLLKGYILRPLLFEFGVNWALIQNNKATDDHFNTAWTLRIIQAVIITILLATFAPLIAQAYGDIRIEEICLIIALSTLIQGFENIGTVKFQKEMNFSKDFWYNVSPKIFATVITIALAFYYQSYYALIVATLFNSIIKVAISYKMISYRPRLYSSWPAQLLAGAQRLPNAPRCARLLSARASA